MGKKNVGGFGRPNTEETKVAEAVKAFGLLQVRGNLEMLDAFRYQ
jgi:hypothetical protein